MSRFSPEPADQEAFTRAFDRTYTRFARVYDYAVRVLPVWKTWLRHCLPHLRGPRVLEVSFGTGYLMTQYAERFTVCGVDLNAAMVATARRSLARIGVSAGLCRGRVEVLPFRNAVFDCVLNTMAFSGYPDATRAFDEMLRVLRPGGRLVLLDVAYPRDANRLGTAIVDLWKKSGDLIRDLRPHFSRHRLTASEREVGGRGSIHLYVADKP